MTQSETVTLFNAMCIMAPATLIDPAITLEPVDAHRVKSRFSNAGYTIQAELSFSDAGELTNFVSDDRYQVSPDGTTLRRVRWSTPVHGYRSFGAARLAAAGEAAGTNPAAHMRISSSRSMTSSTTCPTGRTPMLIDELMPVYDISDAVATVVDADVATTWDALMEVDLLEVGRKKLAVALLGALRILPDLVNQLLRGSRPSPRPDRMRLQDMATIPLGDGGWVLLGRRDRKEIALGLIGKFWRPVIEFGNVTSAAEFRAFAEPGFAKTIYALSVQGIGLQQTLLSGVMRTSTTDDHARRWFRRYWTLGIGSGAHVLANGLLDVTRETAEAKAARSAA
jgi:hypothetical protein